MKFKPIVDPSKVNNFILRDYKKWCDDNGEYVGTKTSIDKFAKNYNDDTEKIIIFLNGLFTLK